MSQDHPEKGSLTQISPKKTRFNFTLAILGEIRIKSAL